MRDIDRPLTLCERQTLPFIVLCQLAPIAPWLPIFMQHNMSRFSFGSEVLLEVRYG